MSEPTHEEKKPESGVQLYDPAGKNRFEFNDGEIVHVYGPLDDERYVAWLKDMKVRGSDNGEVEEESREAACRLWDDTIDHLENVEFDGEPNAWKEYVPFDEKIESINNFLAVGCELEKPKGPRRLAPLPSEITATTEAWFNGDVLKQTHTMRPKTLELEKKYSRIQANRFKQEQVNGFRNKKKVTYIPQDEKLGQLYDEMVISVNGFAVAFDNKQTVPLRFKTAVIHEIFASKLDPKK